MSFNSLAFAVYFPFVVACFFALPRRLCWGWLLLASYVFYAAYLPVFLLLLWTSTLVDYLAAKAIDGQPDVRKRRRWLVLSLLVNLGLLAGFKYGGFLSQTVSLVSTWMGGSPSRSRALAEVIVPIGISFYTFQTLGYVVDVFRGKCRAEKDLLRFALYVAYFPQLVAGPIERAARLMPQLVTRSPFSLERCRDGLLLMAWGFFKKLVIADRAALLSDPVFSSPGLASSAGAWLGLYAFSIQIYADFSGYTDIARGASRILGIGLSENFKRPYAAVSLREFWRRWHMSLSGWLRDYLYIPLGGNRSGTLRRCYAVTLVFLLGGLWHGPTWMFVGWGAWHAVALMVEIVAARLFGSLTLPRAWMRRLIYYARVFVTFHVVTLSWLFFRAASMQDVGVLWGALRSWRSHGAEGFSEPGLGAAGLLTLSTAVILMVVAETLSAKARVGSAETGGVVRLVWPAICALGLATFLFGAGETRTFIYFQF